MRILFLAPILLLLCACDSAPPDAPAAVDTAETDVAVPLPSTAPGIRAEDLSAHIQTLASDDFAGRQPGGPGERKTVAYLTQEFKRFGLTPGNGSSYLQQVPMVEITSEATGPVTIAIDGGEDLVLENGKRIVIQTLREDPEVAVRDSGLVFVGFGVNAPELNWNDYAGLDVKGKTVVMLVNDPGFETGDETLFGGKAMTYYGRWTYKYEEALRQGASAAIIVHDTAGAAYGWEVVQNSFVGAEFDLPHKAGEPQPLAVRGWMTTEAATELFQRVGRDFAAERIAANTPGFTGYALPARASMALTSRVRHAESANVVALVKGTETPDEVLIFTAHWDHFGRNFQSKEDGIFNGAIDNATGVAALLELAEAFAAAPPKRSLMFLVVTLEESGLLGSRHYTESPLVPLNKTVATINMDAIQVIGRTRDVVVIGYGKSSLDEVLREKAAAQGRVIVPEPTPENGFYYRSDHFNFARVGVPSLYAKNGHDHIEKGEAYGRKIAEDYVANDYHKPSDEFDPNWDLSGNVEDAQLNFEVARQIANDGSWPTWPADSEFKAARDAMMVPQTP